MSVNTDSCLWVEAGRADGSPPLRARQQRKQGHGLRERTGRRGVCRQRRRNKISLWENKKVMRPETCGVIAKQHEGPPGR